MVSGFVVVVVVRAVILMVVGVVVVIVGVVVMVVGVVVVVVGVLVKSFKMFIFENDKLLAFTGRFPKYQIPLTFRIAFLTIVFNDWLVISLF